VTHSTRLDRDSIDSSRDSDNVQTLEDFLVELQDTHVNRTSHTRYGSPHRASLFDTMKIAALAFTLPLAAAFSQVSGEMWPNFGL
jgi:hypothetical protein